MKSMFYIFYKTEKDLIKGAIKSISSEINHITMINNSSGESTLESKRVEVITPEVPLNFSQTFNLARKLTIEQKMDVMFTMHSDGFLKDKEVAIDLVKQVAGIKDKWGQVLTNHDVLTAYNVEMMKDIGEMDTVFQQYYADIDYFRRMLLSGWKVINSDLITRVEHKNGGSYNIKNDPFLKLTQEYTFPLYQSYYVSKWGGDLGEEKYKVPFNEEVK